MTTKRPGGIGFAADAWGLACTILELASGSPPFSGQAGVSNVMDVLNMLMNVRLRPVKFEVSAQAKAAGAVLSDSTWKIAPSTSEIVLSNSTCL